MIDLLSFHVIDRFWRRLLALGVVSFVAAHFCLAGIMDTSSTRGSPNVATWSALPHPARLHAEYPDKGERGPW